MLQARAHPQGNPSINIGRAPKVSGGEGVGHFKVAVSHEMVHQLPRAPPKHALCHRGQTKGGGGTHTVRKHAVAEARSHAMLAQQVS